MLKSKHVFFVLISKNSGVQLPFFMV